MSLGIGGWLQTLGAREVIPHDSRMIGGPFFLDAAIANGSATAVDLAAQDAWYGDAAARGAYTPSNGSATKMQATLHLEAAELLIVDSDFTVLVTTTKDNLWSSQLYLQIQASGSNYYVPLDKAVTDAIRATVAAATSSPATTTGAQILGIPFVLPSALRIDLQQDTIQLASTADVALGAAIDTKVVLYGGLFPNAMRGAGSDAPHVAAMPRFSREYTVSDFVRQARASYQTTVQLLGRPAA